MNLDLGETGSWPLLIIVPWFALVVIVHILFAVGVARDAAERDTEFVGGGVWAAATLMGGVFVAAAYWFIHLSALSGDRGMSSERDS